MSTQNPGRKKQSTAGMSRRGLLTAAPLAGVALAASGRARAEEPSQTPADPHEPGYRETDHIRAYYARARD